MLTQMKIAADGHGRMAVMVKPNKKVKKKKKK
jgi:hypothetical protein